MSLNNLKNLAYNILKNLEDESVRDMEVPELGSCLECNNEILILPIKVFMVLSCGHVFYRECIKKNFLLTQQNNCLIDNCTVIINPVVTEWRFSVSSQSSTSSIVRR